MQKSWVRTGPRMSRCKSEYRGRNVERDRGGGRKGREVKRRERVEAYPVFLSAEKELFLPLWGQVIDVRCSKVEG